MRHRLMRLLNALISSELRPLIVMGLIALGLWAFISLAGAVAKGNVLAFDRDILLAMRNHADLNDPIGSAQIEELARDVTALGGVGVLSFITLSVAGYLLLIRKYRTMLLILIAIGGGALLTTLLKGIYARPRPDLELHQMFVVSASFPSGHSMLSAVTYLTLGVLLTRLQPHRRVKAYIIGLALLLTLMVGISRVYLGVHWPTDVLAGWVAGCVWALLCYFAARRLQRRGQIDAADAIPPLDTDTER